MCLILLAAIGATAPPAAAQAQSRDLKASAQELERARARIQALQTRLDRDRGRQDELRGQLEQTERRIADIAAGLRELNEDIRRQAAEVKRIQAERGEAERALRAERQALARQVRAAYVIGQRGKTKLVLNQDRMPQLSRVVTYYDYLHRVRAGHIERIGLQVERLLGLERRLKAESERLQTLRNRQTGALQALEAGRAERRQTLKTLAARIRNEAGELKQLQANEQELRGLLNSLRDALSDIPLDLGRGRPFGKLKGRLPWPLRGKLLARFGAPKVGDKLRWNGVWIQGQEGDPVRAVARGRVAYVGWMHRYGLIVVLEHEGGYYTLYGHNQSVTAQLGEWLDPGDALARVGDSGGHSRTGLYFEIRKGTDALDPRQWLAR